MINCNFKGSFMFFKGEALAIGSSRMYWQPRKQRASSIFLSRIMSFAALLVFFTVETSPYAIDPEASRVVRM